MWSDAIEGAGLGHSVQIFNYVWRWRYDLSHPDSGGRSRGATGAKLRQHFPLLALTVSPPTLGAVTTRIPWGGFPRASRFRRMQAAGQCAVRERASLSNMEGAFVTEESDPLA